MKKTIIVLVVAFIMTSVSIGFAADKKTDAKAKKENPIEAAIAADEEDDDAEEAEEETKEDAKDEEKVTE